MLLFSACSFGNTVNIRYSKDPEIMVKKGNFLILPFTSQTMERLPDESAIRIFREFLDTNENSEIKFIAHDQYSYDMVQKIAPKIINNEKVDLSFFATENIQYIITGVIFYETKLFANKKDDGMSPAFSADYSGYPGLWESSEEWKRRSYSDLIFELRAELFIYDIAGKKTVFQKKFMKFAVLEDYRRKSIPDEQTAAYQLLLQDLSQSFLKCFSPQTIIAERFYLK